MSIKPVSSKDTLFKMFRVEEQEDVLEDKIAVLAVKLYKTRMRLVGAGGTPNRTFPDLMEYAAILEAEDDINK